MSRETTNPVGFEVALENPGHLEVSKKRLLAKAGAIAGALALAAAAAAARPEAAFAHTGTPGAQPPPAKMFGVFEGSRLDLAAETGFKVVEKDLWVTPGHRSLAELPQADQDDFHDYMKRARDNGQKVVLNLWQVGWPVNGKQNPPPNRPYQWRDMCDVGIDAIQTEQTDAAAGGQSSAITGFVLGVEPNSSHFWKIQANAGAAYENWLAACYSKIKTKFPDIPVYGGSLASRADPGGTGPGEFIQQMCQAYTKNGNGGPIMDGFDMHSYETEAPETAHPNTDVITIGDYDKLQRLLGCFGRGKMPILWGEIAYQTGIEAGQSYRYKSSESAAGVLDELTQGRYYSTAIQMVYCLQPKAVGLFFFHEVDDPNLQQWQSGLYYANPNRKLSGGGRYADAAKQSLSIVQKALTAAENGDIQCA